VDPLLGVDYFRLAAEPLEAVRAAWGLEAAEPSA